MKIVKHITLSDIKGIASITKKLLAVTVAPRASSAEIKCRSSFEIEIADGADRALSEYGLKYWNNDGFEPLIEALEDVWAGKKKVKDILDKLIPLDGWEFPKANANKNTKS